MTVAADPAERFDDLIVDFPYEGRHGTHRFVVGRVAFDDADDLYGIIDVNGNRFERAYTLQPAAWKRFTAGLLAARDHGPMSWESACLVTLGLGGEEVLWCKDDGEVLRIGSDLYVPVAAAAALAGAIVARRLIPPRRIGTLSDTLLRARF